MSNEEGSEEISTFSYQVTFSRVIGDILIIQVALLIFAETIEPRGWERFAEGTWFLVPISIVISYVYAKIKIFNADHMDLLIIHPILLLIASSNFHISTIGLFIFLAVIVVVKLILAQHMAKQTTIQLNHQAVFKEIEPSKIEVDPNQIFQAVVVGDIVRIKALLDAGVSSNLKDVMGSSLLQLAQERTPRKARDQVISLLLERGATDA